MAVIMSNPLAGNKGFLKKLVRLFPIFLLPFAIIADPLSAAGGDGLERIRARGHLLWGGDAEEGAPFIFADPKSPGALIGFEVEIVRAIAAELGVKDKFVQKEWDGLIPALKRGEFDLAVNGIAITRSRMEEAAFSRAYYVCTKQIVVRKGEDRIGDLKDLSGKRVGTLSGTVAQSMLEEMEKVNMRIYSRVVDPYEDLALGRLDAVLLEYPIAVYYARPDPRLKFAGPPVGEVYYGIAVRKEDKVLKEEVDGAIDRLLRKGEMKRIYDKWGLWNEAQEKLHGMSPR